MTDLYQPEDIGNLYPARTAAYLEKGLQSQLSPSTEDQQTTLLLLIDMQVDFVLKNGALSVPGALDDTRRVIDLIYRHPDKITDIIASLDTHPYRAIFFPSWWVDQEGNQPPLFTVITTADVNSEKWIPVSKPDWSKYYVRALERRRKVLTIWPYHTLFGTAGQILVPALSEAISYHSGARSAIPRFVSKGTGDEVEHYGIFAPEITPRKIVFSNMVDLIDYVKTYHRIIVAGEAKSHCVLETLRQLAQSYPRGSRLDHITLLTDCTSSVWHPTNDYDNAANLEINLLARRGLQLCDSQSVF